MRIPFSAGVEVPVHDGRNSTRPRLRLGIAAILYLISSEDLFAGQDTQEATRRASAKTELLESTGQELFQIDVSVLPRKKDENRGLPTIRLEEFDLIVFGRPTAIRYVDRVCTAAPSGRAPREDAARTTEGDSSTRTAPETAVPPNSIATYLFYFEHSHLTMGGLNAGLEMAEKLIPELIQGGNRGMVISSGRGLVQTELTDDSDTLLAALRRVRRDPGQWAEYAYAEGEDRRLREIGYRMRSSSSAALSLARQYELEERAMTNNRLRRFAATLGVLADVDAPKGVFYFADIIRSNAGEHYLRGFGNALLNRSGNSPGASSTLAALGMDAFSADFAFDAVTREAGANGARVYTVHAEGLQHTTTSRRLQDAEGTLTSMALETGGRMFQGGTDRKTLDQILDRVASDLGCLYLLSFDPGELPRDRTLPVLVRFNPDSDRAMELSKGYKLGTRGQIVIRSPEARKESIVMAAHAASSAVDATPGRGAVIPLGFDDGRFLGLAQLAVAGSERIEGVRGGSIWELGMTSVAGSKTIDSVSARIESNDPRAMIVLESEWNFKPGTGDLVSVGYENRFGRLVTASTEQNWPDPDASRFSITRIAVVQPMEGLFLRKSGDLEEPLRTSGSLAIGDGPVIVDRPTYAIALICRGRRVSDAVWVHRELVGAQTAEFDSFEWGNDGKRCIQVRDLVRVGQMSWGDFRYHIRVYDNSTAEGMPLAEASRSFSAVEPTSHP